MSKDVLHKNVTTIKQTETTTTKNKVTKINNNLYELKHKD